MKTVQILAFASTVSSVVHGYESSSSASDSIQSTMLFATKEDSSIKNGSLDATSPDYPYLARLRVEGRDATFCSGTLIGSQHILTAGHCIQTETDVVIAYFGTDVGSSSKEEQRKVISSYRHQTNLYDVGLLKLEEPSAQKTATLCATDGSDNPIGTKATALEWGITEDGSLSHTLLEAHVSLIASTECSKQYSNHNMEGMICAGYDDVKDSCSGGNGGPLVTADDILIGFASSREQCGVNIGIYTGLTFVIDYVNAILSGGTGSNLTDSPMSMMQQTPTFKESTAAVTPVASISTPASAINTPASTMTLTTVASIVPVASDCTFHRHLSEKPPRATVGEMEEVIEMDMDSAKKAKKAFHTVSVEADKEIEMLSGGSNTDDKIIDILKTKATAEEEEKKLDEEIREDKEQEEEIYEEEIEQMNKRNDKIKQKEEDDTSSETSDKSSKKTSKKTKIESEEQEETTPVSSKTTKKSAEKSKAEEDEKELEDEIEEEFEELLQEEEEEEEKNEKEKEEVDEDDEDEDMKAEKKEKVEDDDDDEKKKKEEDDDEEEEEEEKKAEKKKKGKENEDDEDDEEEEEVKRKEK